MLGRRGAMPQGYYKDPVKTAATFLKGVGKNVTVFAQDSVFGAGNYTAVNLIVGGQAVMEGVMMRTPSAYAIACRKSDGSIVTTPGQDGSILIQGPGVVPGYWRDEILTNLTLYWLTDTIGPSMRMYAANGAIPLERDAYALARRFQAAPNEPFDVAREVARIVRGNFLSLREKEYIEAAKAVGASDFRIILRHMLPNAMGPIVVNATLVVAIAILVEAVLSFLGFGVQPPTPALGTLIAKGQGLISQWWLVTFPGLTIVLICLCINFIGDGLRDALDPTQRRTSG